MPRKRGITMRPYKKRRLKNDPAHRLLRQARKLQTRSNPALKRKRRMAQKLYYRKNKRLLQKKAEMTRKTRQS